jgi:hypothetical protein
VIFSVESIRSAFRPGLLLKFVYRDQFFQIDFLFTADANGAE